MKTKSQFTKGNVYKNGQYYYFKTYDRINRKQINRCTFETTLRPAKKQTKIIIQELLERKKQLAILEDIENNVESDIENNVENIPGIYLLDFKNYDFFKIGKSTNIRRRQEMLSETWGPIKTDKSFMLIIPSPSLRTALERIYKEMFKHQRRFGSPPDKGFSDGYSEIYKQNCYMEAMAEMTGQAVKFRAELSTFVQM